DDDERRAGSRDELGQGVDEVLALAELAGGDGGLVQAHDAVLGEHVVPARELLAGALFVTLALLRRARVDDDAGRGRRLPAGGPGGLGEAGLDAEREPVVLEVRDDGVVHGRRGGDEARVRVAVENLPVLALATADIETRVHALV